MSRRINLNADLGESFGAWRMGDDDALLRLVGSANVACGFHAGDPATMRRTVRLAMDRGVAVGAHPSLPDLQGFGRRPMDITPLEAYELALYQIGALGAFVRAAGGRLNHVKPHGALYTQASRDRALADGIARAVRDFDPSLILFGLSGSELVAAGRAAGLSVAREAFADRGYQRDGSLVPRSQAGARVEDVDAAVERGLRMALEGRVMTPQSEWVSLEVDTLCIHGDNPGALECARRLRAALEGKGLRVTAPVRQG